MREEASTPLKAAVYARISQDRDGEALGVERQEQDCRDLAERLGWDVAAVFVDNDISASTRSTKPRPQYEEMLRGVKAGRFGAVLAYSNSRLTRRPAEWLTLINLANTGHLRIKTLASGEYDLSTADGRAVALTVAAWDAAEAERTGERVARRKKQAAEDGKYRGGPRPYGYESDGVTLRPSEAEVVADMTAAVLAGRSLASMARELNEAGRTTSNGRPWNYQRLRDVLVRPRNAGLVHSGRADRGRAEILGPASWDAIVDEDTWRAAYEVLTDSSRARRLHTNTDARWLGSGIFVCGRCGAAMRPTTTRDRRGLHYHYRCSDRSHLSIAAVRTDEYVRAEVAALVRDPRIIAALRDDDGTQSADRERRAVLAARLETFEGDYAAGAVTGQQLAKATATVTAEIAEIDERMSAGLQRSASAEVMDNADPGAAFLNAPVDVQRAVLRTVCTVTVQPSPRRGLAWTSDRLELGPVAAFGPEGENA